MKKIALLLSFILCAFFSFAQFPNSQSTSNDQTLFHYKGALIGDKSIMIPVIDTLNNPALPYRGALTVRPQDSMLYMSDGVRWIPFLSNSNAFIIDSVYVERPLAVKIGTSGASTGKQVIYFLKESGLISGGIPVSTGCRTLLMPPSIYNINFNQYTSLATNLTIDTSHATLNRTDRIVGDTNGVVYVIKGTNSSLGLPPTYDPSSEFSLALIPVPAAAACTPPSSSIKVVYDENLGVAGGEYDPTTVGAVASDLDNTDNPYHLTKADFISTYVDSSQLVFTNTGLQDTATSTSVLVLPTYLNVPLTNPIQVEFFLGTTSVSNNTVINSYLNALDTGQYQVAAIPFAAFGFSSNFFNKIVFTFRGYDTSGAAGLYFDWIQIQKGITFTQPQLTLTTNGTSGASTLINNVLNIPQYAGATYTAGNGITDSSSRFILGGSLYKNTAITATTNQLALTFNGIAGTTGLDLSASSTAAASGLQKVLAISLSGVNATATQTTYGVHVSNTHTGTGANNYGGYFNIAGAGYAGYFNATSGRGVYAQTTSGTAVTGASSSGIGVSASSTSSTAINANSGTGYGLYATSGTGYPGSFTIINPNANNTIDPVLQLVNDPAFGGSVGANGIGLSVDFKLKPTSGAEQISNQLISKWTDATTATRTSEFSITGVNSAVTSTLFTLAGSGQLTFNNYASSGFYVNDSTNNKPLVVNSSGVVSQGNWSGGGGGGGSSFTRQVITGGSSGTVTGGNYIVTINPASLLASFALTMPASPSDMDIVKVEFGGTLTSGIIITALTIVANSGQTIIDNTPPGSATADNYLEYQYRLASTQWYRRKP